jgi:hypothetical protein
MHMIAYTCCTLYRCERGAAANSKKPLMRFCVLSVWKLIPDRQGELTLALEMARPEPADASTPNGHNGKDSFGNGYFGKKMFIIS